MIKVSILDQSPMSSGKTAGEALQESLQLAQIGEELGYARYWIAEHHDFSGLSCSTPEVMLGYIGAQTKTIRIGSGAVLLPHYKPYKVAETYNMLATLFPSRMDVGIGRAPGGSSEATTALSDNFLQQVWKMPESFTELLHFLYNDFPADHPYQNLQAAPVPSIPPQPWVLGTSEKSAKLAAENGVAYAFGHFMSEKNGPEIMQHYLQHFKQRKKHTKPETIVAVSVICAETTEKAEEIALSLFLWNIQQEKGDGGKGVPSIEEAKTYFRDNEEKERSASMRKKIVIGSPKEVKQRLMELQTLYGADEMMLVTITHRFGDRIQSYRLLAEELGLGTKKM